MSNKQKSTTTTDMGPWSAQQPYIKDMFQRAQDWMNSSGDRTYYPSDTVAGFDPAQDRALSGIEGRAQTGNPLLPAAQNLTQATLRGDFLAQGNPYLGAVTDSVRANVLPGVDARFGASGRFGSPAHAGAVASATANAIAPYAFGSYQDERKAQQQASLLAPDLAQADYADLDRLYAAGGARQGQAQNEINADVARHDWNRDQPLRDLAAYHDLIGGSYGQSGTSTTTQSSGNPWVTGAGLILGGINTAAQLGGFGPTAQMGSMFGGGGGTGGFLSPSTMQKMMMSGGRMPLW